MADWRKCWKCFLSKVKINLNKTDWNYAEDHFESNKNTKTVRSQFSGHAPIQNGGLKRKWISTQNIGFGFWAINKLDVIVFSRIRY